MLRFVLFDLDNTLYPESAGMDRDITRRMIEYVARYLGMSTEEARRFRHEHARKYGTTLEWLRAEHGFVDIEDYFAAVHPEGEEYCIEADPALARVLDSLPQRKAVLTNSPMEHAERILAKLGVRGHFDEVFDIRYNGLLGKPYADAYRRACEACGFGVDETVFIDDLPKYVRGFLDLGGRAILVDEANRFPDEGLERIRSLEELPARIEDGSRPAIATPRAGS